MEERTGYQLVRPASLHRTAIRFGELKDAHTPGDTSTCYERRWTGSDYETDADTEFEAVDARGEFRGRGKDQYNFPHDAGSYVECVLRNGQWEIIWMTPHATEIEGYAVADFTASTTTIDGVTISTPDGSIIVDQDPAAAMTVSDIMDWNGSADNLIVARWHAATETWRIREIVCP